MQTIGQNSNPYNIQSHKWVMEGLLGLTYNKCLLIHQNHLLFCIILFMHSAVLLCALEAIASKLSFGKV
jgi:hypothetical protein